MNLKSDCKCVVQDETVNKKLTEQQCPKQNFL